MLDSIPALERDAVHRYNTAVYLQAAVDLAAREVHGGVAAGFHIFGIHVGAVDRTAGDVQLCGNGHGTANLAVAEVQGAAGDVEGLHCVPVQADIGVLADRQLCLVFGQIDCPGHRSGVRGVLQHLLAFVHTLLQAARPVAVPQNHGRIAAVRQRRFFARFGEYGCASRERFGRACAIDKLQIPLLRIIDGVEIRSFHISIIRPGPADEAVHVFFRTGALRTELDAFRRLDRP